RSSSQHSQSLHQPRPGLAPLGKQDPISPTPSTTSFPPSTYPPNHSLGNGILQSQSAYGPPSQEPPYYTTHPTSYTTASASAQYPSSGPPDLMATAAQMQRPAYPPIYHTPQSNSPASVASQPHDQHIAPDATPDVWLFTIFADEHGATVALRGASFPTTTHPHLAIHDDAPSDDDGADVAAPILPQPQRRAVQQPSHENGFQLPARIGATTDAPRAPLSTSNTGLQAGSIHQISPLGTSSSAAPGPIPATTPLVVRQDSNGVQWIAFEYSRDRVKMEYTIRCDVESVNVESLSQEFKTENCVYPRACCNKDQYRGNRLVYETECNTVGWALAELNASLRGKRGLIQRAVDSWRNSNQDPRLRSRRVRRQAKVNYRKQSMAPPTPHMPAPGPMGPGLPSTPSMQAPGPRQSIGGPGPMVMGPPQLHHHHAQPDGSPKIEEVSGTTDYTSAAQHSIDSARLPPAPHAGADLRRAQAFHDATPVPKSSSAGPSMPPPLRDSGLAALGRHPTIAASSSRMGATAAHADAVGDVDISPTNDDLFGQLPDGKRRTFILVEDPQRGARVRVKVMLDKVNMDEIPDSYRMTNAVYPRTYFPVQMKDAPGALIPGRRFFHGDEQDDEDSTVGRTSVAAPSLDGERDVDVPRLSRRRHQKEVLLNDLGYRLSWSQSRVFAGRMLFLQRSLDAYRNKMRSSILAAGQDAADIPEHFDTRRGKRRFLERGGRRLETEQPSASRRSAEEVES
ncbi:uncharacterized protein N7482_002540, partial [Penicillium canariense]